MSQSGKYDTSTILADIETLTGNAGGAVGPDVAGNVDIVGADGVVVTGTPASNLLTITHPPVDEIKILYVGKHGNDANDGKTIAKAKLTFQNAIDAAGADYTVVCFDDGNYTEDLTIATSTNIFAPNAALSGAHTITNNVSLVFAGISVATATVGFTFNSVNQYLYINATALFNIEGTGIGIVCTNGIVNLNATSVVIDDGNLVGSATADSVNVICNSIEFIGTGTAFSCATSGLINAIITSIYNTGIANGQLFETTGVGVPEISATISYANLEKLSDITAGSIVKMNAVRLNGSMAEAGAGNVFMGGATRIDGVTIGDVTPSNATFTTLAAQSCTIDPGSGDSAINFDINTTNEFTIGVDDDDSDSFKISQGGSLGTTDTFIMSSSGERTMPLQPAFSAYNSTIDSNVTGDASSVEPVEFDTELFDQNDDYNNATDTFTASVTGLYKLSFGAQFRGLTASHTNGAMQIVTSNRSYLSNQLSYGAIRSSGDLVTYWMEALVDMDAGDTAHCSLFVAGGTKVVDIGAGGPGTVTTCFQGYLMC